MAAVDIENRVLDKLDTLQTGLSANTKAVAVLSAEMAAMRRENTEGKERAIADYKELRKILDTKVDATVCQAVHTDTGNGIKSLHREHIKIKRWLLWLTVVVVTGGVGVTASMEEGPRALIATILKAIGL